MTWRPIREPNAALTGRWQVSRRYAHVRGVWLRHAREIWLRDHEFCTAGEENGKSKGT